MPESKWLNAYMGQSTDELIALEGEYRTDSLVFAFEAAIQEKSGYVGMDGLTKEENVILAVEGLEREVNNGGYHQFFVNSSVQFAPIIVDALMRIASPIAASITQDAINALAIDDPLTVQAIEAVIYDDDRERDGKLWACDRRYFDEVGSLAEPLFKFIVRNKDKIDLSYEKTPKGW